MKNTTLLILLSLFIMSCEENPVIPIDECGVSNGDGVV
tara:strand:+ start:693 stop:806 length:114 start_codon:yes stop_codon:yes gene_type:complete